MWTVSSKIYKGKEKWVGRRDRMSNAKGSDVLVENKGNAGNKSNFFYEEM